MRTLYLECAMGAAGDMLLAALTQLLPDPAEFVKRLNSLELPGVAYVLEPAVRCGITGCHMNVTVNGETEEAVHGGHCHSTLGHIHEVIDQLAVSDLVKELAKAVYGRIAAAESAVHGEPVEAVHFHEIGAWDAVADVVGVCLAMEALAPEQVVVSPVHVGSGHVSCAHGILPVPAPATAELLKGVPIYGGTIQGELCTPTGAALLTQFAHSFGSMPCMTTEKVAWGMGAKDFPRVNGLRAFWGETAELPEEITELSCNLDDMTPEAVAFAAERLMEAGALDVYTTAIGMKKNRSGLLLTCLCKPEETETFVTLILRHTTTLGVRRKSFSRYTLQREISVTDTPYGPVRIKKAHGFGVTKEKAEYEDLAAIARAHDLTLQEVLAHLK